MSDLLTGEPRNTNLSKGELNRFRRDGKIPAVIYGKGTESIPFFVNLIEFRNIYSKNGKVFEINVAGKTELVNTKVIDTTNLGKITHINFHKLKRGEKTTMKVPVSLTGESKGAKAGGVLQQLEDTVSVTAVPKDIPESIQIDITELEIGQSINTGEIKLPKGLTLETEADKTIVNCQAPQKQEEEAPAEDTSEEATEAPAAEGADAPAEENEA